MRKSSLFLVALLTLTAAVWAAESKDARSCVIQAIADPTRDGGGAGPSTPIAGDTAAIRPVIQPPKVDTTPRCPNCGGEDTKMRFNDLYGEVSYRCESEEDDAYEFAELDTVIYANHRIRTKEESGAILSLEDMSTFTRRDGAFAPLAAYLPKELGTVPRPQLRVCEAAVQQDFFAAMFEDAHEGLEQLVFEHPSGKEALTHVDCFAGPGGICTGLHAAGFETKVAIEYIRSCVDTYSTNHPSVHVIHSDIRKVLDKQVVPYIPRDGIDLVTSGMPCETFSTAGNTSADAQGRASLPNRAKSVGARVPRDRNTEVLKLPLGA